MFFDLARKSFESRNYKPSGRKDAIDFLLNLKEQGFMEGEGMRFTGEAKKVKLEANETMLVSQVLVFFVAGFSTSSTYLSLALYEMAKNQHHQQRLYEEIESVIAAHDGEVTYDAIQEMKFLDNVINEVMRLYPVLGALNRECTEDYIFPEYNLKIERGVRIHVPLYAIHLDPKYYPDPLKFDPDRFTTEEVAKRPAFTYLAWGEGYRNCIGLRFAKLEMAFGLLKVIREYHLDVCDKTVKDIVKTFDPKTFSITYRCPLYLMFTPRNKIN